MEILPYRQRTNNAYTYSGIYPQLNAEFPIYEMHIHITGEAKKMLRIKLIPSYLNGQHHNGQRSCYIDVQFKVVNYCRVTALWKHKDGTLSRESIGYKLAELQRQLKQHHSLN